MKYVQPVANGISTDHPVPGLPFVDDSGIDKNDPRAIEAIGRHQGTDMWGRWDGERRLDEDTPGQWWAFTTVPERTELAWCVRFHPEHGRSVLLVRDEDASSMHTDWEDDVLLLRAGGYWWDGTDWYRPSQVFDQAKERYVRRRAKTAVTVTAADLLDRTADPTRATVGVIHDIDPDAGPVTRWTDHLALWATRRPDNALPLERCVVNLSAPELGADQLIGATELAAMANIEPSTLRAYQARGETDLPDPQATISGRNVWSKPVAADWIEQRTRSSGSVAATMAAGNTAVDEFDNNLSRGEADIRHRFTGTFFSWLWNPARRKSWVLRRRNEESVKRLAGELAWYVASDLDHIIPTAALAYTIRCAVLKEVADDVAQQNAHYNGEPQPHRFVGIAPKLAIMLDWLIRHHPSTAAHTINEIIGEAERTWDMPRNSIIRSIEIALSLDGKLPEKGGYDAFFALVLPPVDE
ncbi:hypothetical protein ACWDO0_27855 [Nocardia rhamnosiphila]